MKDENLKKKNEVLTEALHEAEKKVEYYRGKCETVEEETQEELGGMEMRHNAKIQELEGQTNWMRRLIEKLTLGPELIEGTQEDCDPRMVNFCSRCGREHCRR